MIDDFLRCSGKPTPFSVTEHSSVLVEEDFHYFVSFKWFYLFDDLSSFVFFLLKSVNKMQLYREQINGDYRLNQDTWKATYFDISIEINSI